MRRPLLIAAAAVTLALMTALPANAVTPQHQTICVSQTSEKGAYLTSTSDSLYLEADWCWTVRNDGSARVHITGGSWRKGYAGKGYTGCHNIPTGSEAVSNPANSERRVTYKAKDCPVTT